MLPIDKDLEITELMHGSWTPRKMGWKTLREEEEEEEIESSQRGGLRIG